jgi:hypothetical protein
VSAVHEGTSAAIAVGAPRAARSKSRIVRKAAIEAA